MRIVFWMSLLVILYTYAGYPLLMACLAARNRRSPACHAWPQSAERPISIIMAVHNGGPLITGKVQHLLQLEPYLVREVTIVSDGSTDGTDATLRSYEDPRLKVIIVPEQVGKAAALNRGIAASTGEILVFIDIRPRVEAGALAKLLEHFADPQVGCVAGQLLLTAGTHDGTTAAVSGLYWKYEQWIRDCEARWDSPVGVYGGFYAVRRQAAVELPPGIILDDMFQPLSIIRQGYRSVLARSAFVYDMWPETTSGEFARKVRTLAGNFQLLALAPWVLTPKNRVAFQLISHKLLRLVVPYLFILLLVSSFALAFHSAIFLLFALAQAVFWAVAAVSTRFRIPMLHRIGAPASALLMLNAAAVAGLYKFAFTRGPLWKIWSPTPVAAARD